MTLCVTGMHRSGTSMVMSMLHGLGLHVGNRADLIPGNTGNPDGHWENVHFVDLDDAVLSALGGAWDLPPAATPAQRGETLAALQRRAIALPVELGLRAPWGWKDPRASLVLPFWLGVYPDLRVLVCLRDPLEVAQSLRRRGYSSYALGLSLWTTYNERILQASSPDQRLVVHYDAFFARPDVEIERMCTFAALECAPGFTTEAARQVKPQQRHSHLDLSARETAGIAPHVIDLYERLCEEAGWPLDGHRRPARRRPQAVDAVLLELGDARRRIASLEAVNTSQELAAQAAAEAQRRDAADIAASVAAVARELGRLEEITIAQQASLAGIAAIEALASADRAATERLGRDLQALCALVDAEHSGAADVARHLADLQAAVRDLLQQQERLRADARYARTIGRVRRLVERILPRHSVVAVISKGDPELVDFADRLGIHFPQAADGQYSGYHPRDDAEALGELDRVRRRGAEFLVVPETAFWWLDEYPAFAAQLRRPAPEVCADDACVIFRLRDTGTGRRREVTREAEEVRS